MPSYDNKVLTGDQLVYFSGLVKTALAAKQDSLVFNTAYNASTNKVATMADIPAIGERILASDVYMESEDDMGGEGSTYTPIDYYINDLYSLIGFPSWDDYETDIVDTETTAEWMEDPEWMGDQAYYSLKDLYNKVEDEIGDKQDALVFNTAYNASSNKVATMSDITTALGGISSFSFEIVQSLPQSNISTSKIYLVAKQTSGTNQVYTEYAYVNNAWEIIGDTSMTIDTLSNSEVATIWATATATT